ncbi:hypothetical protein yc1106_09495 [Curvularia clavata]|uniref:Uncharacterized protein n=1 Tax=Curvularia clavata TaxID=95742 RepID=A0A9Q9DY57_CURCL|nr:hypothetical protein yc1106_09495 [Curvularia clavata]
MTNRPWRSGATQILAVPDEDDIYDDSSASIAGLYEEFKPVEDISSPNFPSNINSNSVITVESQCAAPPYANA